MNLPDKPTWHDLEQLASHGGLSAAGSQATLELFADMQQILGADFPARTFDKFHGLPGELLMFSTHRYVLPQMLSLALRLRRAVDDPTFRTVRNDALSGLDAPAWRHLLLQLEADRACTEMGYHVTFEPPIPGTVRKADLLVDPGESAWVVETTVVLRADMDKSWEKYEASVKHAVRAIEMRHSVACVVALNDHPTDEAGGGPFGSLTEDWLLAADLAAVVARTSRMPQVVRTEHGWVAIYPDAVPNGTVTFTGAVQERDGWKRLRRALVGKARQIEGPLPAWVRIDCLDGLFQFTEWARMPHADRISAIADAITREIQWPDCAQGVVLSSGPAVSLSATDPDAENLLAESEHGLFVRRLIAPYLVRETVIIPIAARCWRAARRWSDAYQSEDTWLDVDLAAAKLPSLNQFWSS